MTNTWAKVGAILTCFAVGYLASLILPQAQKPLEGLTIYTTHRGGETASATSGAATVAAVP